MAENIKTGTTTLGIVCKDGIIIAADKRATAGNYIANRNVDKVIPISDHIAVTISGTVSDAQKFVKYIKAELKINQLKINRSNTIKEVANLISNINYNAIRSQGAIVGFLVGGVDTDGSVHLFNIGPDGSLFEKDTFETSGSGSIFADGVLETNYKPGLSLTEGQRLAKQALNAALLKDSASGNGANIYAITIDGIKKVEEITINTGISVE